MSLAMQGKRGKTALAAKPLPVIRSASAAASEEASEAASSFQGVSAAAPSVSYPSAPRAEEPSQPPHPTPSTSFNSVVTRLATPYPTPLSTKATRSPPPALPPALAHLIATPAEPPTPPAAAGKTGAGSAAAVSVAAEHGIAEPSQTQPPAAVAGAAILLRPATAERATAAAERAGAVEAPEPSALRESDIGLIFEPPAEVKPAAVSSDPKGDGDLAVPIAPLGDPAASFTHEVLALAAAVKLPSDGTASALSSQVVLHSPLPFFWYSAHLLVCSTVVLACRLCYNYPTR